MNRRIIQAWANEEFQRWRARAIDPRELNQRIEEYERRCEYIYLYRVRSGAIEFMEKSGDTVAYLQKRASLYRDHIQDAISGLRPVPDFRFAVHVGDSAIGDSKAPLLSFQRRIGDDILLLPDVDLLHENFYWEQDYRDPVDYDDKSIAAVFVGSTTGGAITLAQVRDPSLPRLKAALDFRGEPSVTFLLPNIVGCDGPTTEAALRAMGLGGPRVPWSEQFNYRYLLSMDGNGATCGRVAVALKSNSLLVKYNSPQELFYFRGLQNGVHYISVASNEAVLGVVEQGRLEPDLHGRIASRGRLFGESVLNPGPCLDYTRELMRGYIELWGRT